MSWFLIAAISHEVLLQRSKDGVIDDSQKVVKPKPANWLVGSTVTTDRAAQPPTVNLKALARPEDPKPEKGTRVLGQNVLRKVRSDMRRTILPSWMNAGPSHPGEAKWGKMKADEWRVFCLVHLPITVI